MIEQGGINGFLGRLRRDNRGNTLAIVAAGIFPLVGMIGGGIDISRIYLTRTRAQQACDAGALAGRKSMTGITWQDTNRDVANQFFNMNFVDHKYGSGAKTITYTGSNVGAVTGTATVVVPMTLMSVFNMPSKTISVTCTADLQLPNTDVMFVLDTTLSMNDVNPGDSNSRIVELRKAVKNFYDELEKVKSPGSSIRYGFVPYSSTVNVGMLLNRDWIVDKAFYDTRVDNGTSQTPGSSPSPTTSTTKTSTVSGSQSSSKSAGPSEKCTAPANENYTDTSTYSAWDPSDTAVPRSQTRTRKRNGITYSASLSNGACTITKTTFNNLVESLVTKIEENKSTGTGSPTTNYNWVYKRINTYPIKDLKGQGPGDAPVSGGSFDLPKIGNKFTNRTITWNSTNGCIEERDTRRPGDDPDIFPRYDMDVDGIPDKAKPATQWRPYLPGLVYGRKNTGYTSTTGWSYTEDAETPSTTDYMTPFNSPYEYGACPSQARKMNTIDASTLTSYLAGLTPAGYTYHDIGFLWGLRLLSRDGLFQTENRAAEATGQVSRNLIFMTDGDTDPRMGSYNAWGIEAIDRRRTAKGAIPTNADLKKITDDRLIELCDIAKKKKAITVWVIAFGTSKTENLVNCATPGNDYQANNAAELAKTFSQIVSQIAQLRITG